MTTLALRIIVITSLLLAHRPAEAFVVPQGRTHAQLATLTTQSIAIGARNPSTSKLHGIRLPEISGIELSGLLYDSTDVAFNAWEWTANIGAPAALVAGAVLVTLSETREDLAPRKKDKNWVRVAKQGMRFLLLTSFALEVVSIFVSTMTGSVLLGHGPAKKAVGYLSPLQLLHHHHE